MIPRSGSPGATERRPLAAHCGDPREWRRLAYAAALEPSDRRFRALNLDERTDAMVDEPRESELLGEAVHERPHAHPLHRAREQDAVMRTAHIDRLTHTVTVHHSGRLSPKCRGSTRPTPRHGLRRTPGVRPQRGSRSARRGRARPPARRGWSDGNPGAGPSSGRTSPPRQADDRHGPRSAAHR